MGITLLDTGDFYGMGHNELLLHEALWTAARRCFHCCQIWGTTLSGRSFIGVDGRPEAVKTALAYTLQRLGTDYIDLYQPARLDPAVPIEDTIRAIAEMVQAGYVGHIGLSSRCRHDSARLCGSSNHLVANRILAPQPWH